MLGFNPILVLSQKIEEKLLLCLLHGQLMSWLQIMSVQVIMEQDEVFHAPTWIKFG